MSTVVDRYEIAEQIAAGGMATVHLGRVRGAVGFARAVAIKRLHQTIAHDPSFVAMFIDEARVAARIRHPNVVPTIDVVATADEILIVMEYVHGESLATLRRLFADRNARIPIPIVTAIMSDVLSGLHAAHETRDDTGALLEIVHRDVSPQNIIVGVDGTSRVLDFGVAKATGRVQTTGEGQVKGKFAYMAPEQFSGGADRRTDVYAAAVVMWELLVGKKLFDGQSAAEILANALARKIPQPRAIAPEIPGDLEDVVLRGLESDPAKRFATARAMNEAMLVAAPRATAFEVAEWVRDAMPQALARKADMVARVERSETTILPSVSAVRATEPPPKRSRRRALVLAAASACALGAFALVGIAFAIHKSGAAPPVLTTAASMQPPPPESSQTLGEIAPVLITTDAQPAPTHAVVHVAKPSKPKPDCNPPYTIDGQGIHHFKEACL